MKTSSMRTLAVIVLGASLLLATHKSASAAEPCIPASVTPARDPVDVVFANAKSDLERRRFEDAAVGFRYLAIHRSNEEIGARAAPLYIEAVNQIGTRLSRMSCFDDIMRDVPRLQTLYCEGDAAAAAAVAAKKHPETCLLLDKVQADIVRLETNQLMIDADKRTGSEAAALYEKAGVRSMDAFTKYCQQPVRNREEPRASGCEEIAYNASRSFRAAGNPIKSIAVLRALIAFDDIAPNAARSGASGLGSGSGSAPNGQRRPPSALAGRATYDLGAMYQAMTVYDLAADWYERFATVEPNEHNADRALSDAVILRIGLGQVDQAASDTRLFLKTFGATSPILSAQVVLAMASYQAEKEDWKAARVTLEGSMTLFEKAPIDLQIRAHGLLAKGGVRPREEYAKVRGFWSDPSAAESRIRNAWMTDDGAILDRRIGKALIVVGEAYLAAADDKRKELVDPLRYPTYAGPNNAAALSTHVQTIVKAWYDQKIAAIEMAEREYIKVLDLKPSPPPSSVIAAGSSVALMWAALVDELAAEARAPSWMRDNAARRAHAAEIDKLREPIKAQRAKPALQKCVLFAARFQWSDPRARACESWLAKNYKAEYHLVDEIVPSLIGETAPPNRVLPLDYDGVSTTTRSATRTKTVVGP